MSSVPSPADPNPSETSEDRRRSTLPTDISFAAKRLSRNPLGIIALFIVLVYAMAAAVLAVAGVSDAKVLPLIYFLTVFPVLVLSAFLWLVSKHSEKLYAPSDFRTDAEFHRTKVLAAINIALADSTKKNSSRIDVMSIVNGVMSILSVSDRNRIVTLLWVDDHPANNELEINAFEALGFRVRTTADTDNAMGILKSRRFDCIITDMTRGDSDEEGYRLAQLIREFDRRTPIFLYTSSSTQEYRREAKLRGINDIADEASTLISLVTSACQ